MKGAGPSPAPLVHAPQVAWREVAWETVVVNLRSNRMVAFNGSGGVLWEACQRPREVAELARAAGLPLEEVEGFLAMLWELGLVVSVPGAAEPLPVLPGPLDEPPRIVWIEQLQTVAAASCAQVPDQSPICNQVPSG